MFWIKWVFGWPVVHWPTMRVGPRTPVGVQLEKAEVGPTSGPTRWLSHLVAVVAVPAAVAALAAARAAAAVEHDARRRRLRLALRLALAARVLDWPKRCELAHAFLWNTAVKS